MIEIRSRWDDRVLYTAENAATVREALEEAVARGAYLHGAYLRGADLHGAYLRGADLRGAYLHDANLHGVYLRGAYLRGADLHGANLHDANLHGANLHGADLHGAYLRGADLRGANLHGADLHGAYLRGAYLRGADLRGAYLHDANLHGVYLRGARGYSPERSDDLRILLDQPGRVRAYKLVDASGAGPFNGGITYALGKTYSVADADENPHNDCGAGINLATLPWCLREWCEGYRILIAEFTAKDIACIPHGTDGKFRVRKAKIVGEYDLAPLLEREARERAEYEAEKAEA